MDGALRIPLLRLLRRASRRRAAALVAFLFAASAQFWAMRVPVSAELPDTLAVPAGETLTLVAPQGRALLHHQGAGSIDVRFERARVAPESAQLLAQIGVALPDTDEPLSWVTTSGAEGVSVLDVVRADPAAAAGRLTLSASRDGGSAVAQLELAADFALRVTVGTSLIPGAPPTRKLLRVGGREIALDGALPLQLSVPAGAPLRVVFPLASPDDALRVSAGMLAESTDRAGALAVEAVGVQGEDARAVAFICAAPLHRWLWRGTGGLAQGRCDGAATFDVVELRVAPGRLEAGLRGSGWSWRAGVGEGERLLDRATDNPALAALLMLVDALLAGWLVLAVASLRRRARYRVFVSYRRGDSAGHAGRLYDRLVEDLGEGAAFIDVEKIPAGSHFERVIAERIAAAETVLVVIAPDWLVVRDAAGRRLDQPGDFVRREVEMALAQGKRVIPVLVGGAAMPAEHELPPSIRPLASLNAVVVSHGSFNRDADALAEIVATSPGEEPLPDAADA